MIGVDNKQTLFNVNWATVMLAGVADARRKRIQSVQNTVGRLLSGVRRRDHITPVLRSLHWLPHGS